MRLFPAIDLIEGKAVRLLRGDYGKMTVFNNDPGSVAAKFEEQGAKYLHVVDLDGAKSGGRPNEAVIKKLIRSTSLHVEVGGGVRDEDAVKTYLDAGAFRVILGTAAAENADFTREMCEKYGGGIAVGADARDGMIAVRGWLENSGHTLFGFAERMQSLGVGTLIVTDISRDGALEGTNVELYRTLAAKYSLDVVASGGVSSVDDIAALVGAGAAGAILGKALYTGALSFSDAIAAAGEQI